MVCLTIIRQLCLLLICNLLVVGAYFEIPSATLSLQPVAAWKAFSQSWVVEFPNNFGSQVLVPQLCVGGVQCSTVDASAQQLSCVELVSLLHAPGWQHANAPFLEEQGCPELFQDWSTPQAISAAQVILSDPCSEACIQALPPRYIEIFLNAQDLAPFATQSPEAESIDGYNLLVRLLYISQTAGIFAVHTSTSLLELHIPRDRAGGVLKLEHECVRRGLRAPPLSSMDLSLTAQGTQICTWTCRPDHVRSPWNLPPPLRTDNKTAHICRPLPRSLSAVEFEFSVFISLQGPVAQLLPQQFFDDLNTLANNFENELQLADAVVSLKVPDSTFDDTTFRHLVDAHVFFRDDGSAHAGYSIHKNEHYAPVGARRLLQQDASAFLFSDGIIFTSDTRASPANIDAEVQRAAATEAVAAPSTEFIVATNNLQIVRLYHNQYVAPIPSTDNRLRDYALAGGGGVLVIISFIVIFLIVRTHSKKK